jgi:hypothetical protein
VCTRSKSSARGLQLRDYQGPDLVILDELEEAYLPVPFDHRGHAGMADMVGGCVVCHHHTPQGRPHPACKTCHPAADAEADIDMPALKGAYHQQCLNCHREWINERDCDACHRLKALSPEKAGTLTSATKDDLLGRMHPPIPEPEGNVYRPGSQYPPGWQVVFRHQDHVHRFGIRCVDCHYGSSCARCHSEQAGDLSRQAPADHHRPCIRCHKRDMDLAARDAGRCERCHWPLDRPPPDPFDHAVTGWPLNRYHQDRTCRACHKHTPFTALSRDCTTCHGDWAPSTFDHAITGQTLDENHRDLDCSLCHPAGVFDRTPTCSECHEPEENPVTFPDQRPGPVVNP